MRVLKIGFLALVLGIGASTAQAAVLRSGNFQLDLYLSAEFEYQWEDEGLGDPNASFDADQVDFAFAYSRDNWRLATDIVIEHGVATELDAGNIELSFGFAEYRFSDAFRFRLGKFLSPLSIQNEFNTVRSSFLTVKNPLSVYKPDKLTENGFRYFPRRQAGLGFTGGKAGQAGYFQWDVLVSNGEQEETNPFEEDNNSQKAISGRLNWEPENVQNLTFGISTYYDTLTEGDAKGTLSALGLALDYGGRSWLVRSEVFVGSLDPDDGEATDQLSAYLDIAYQKGDFTPYFEVQWVETSVASLDESAYGFVVGLFYRFTDAAVIKVENGYFKGSAENLLFTDLPGRDYNELRAAFVIGF